MFTKSFIKEVAKHESVSAAFLERQIKRGHAVITTNNRRPIPRPAAIGQGLKVKINTNLGVSTLETDLDNEVKKLQVAVKAGADTVMDLSVGCDLANIRKTLLKNCPVPLGTVPIYQIVSEVERRKGDIAAITFDDIFDVLKQQAEQGVDFFTIHAGILKKTVPMMKPKKRVCGIVSRGGAILMRWMT